MNNYDLLKQKLIDKMQKEMNDFKNDLRTKNVDLIMDKAYELACKEEMLYFFESDSYDVFEIKALLNLDNTLDSLYDEWLDVDININSQIEDALSDYIYDLGIEYKKENMQKETAR